MNKYVDIILPITAVRQNYTYSVPEEMVDNIKVGMRVIVNFGAKRFYTGVVLSIHNNKPDYKTIKPIATLLDDEPIVNSEQLQFWQFISEYYCCGMGDIFKSTIPSALKIESESYISLADKDLSNKKFTPKQTEILEILSDGKSHTMSEFTTSQLRSIKRLIETGTVNYSDVLVDKYRPKYQTITYLNNEYCDEDKLSQLLKSTQRAKKQRQLIDCYLEHCPLKDGKFPSIERTKLLELAATTSTIFKILVDKNIFILEKEKLERFSSETIDTEKIHKLSKAQQTALNKIKQSYKTHNTTLLYGITSSGKTELYIKLIEETIAQGKQVLMLIPEIGLTQHLASRMRQFFGNDMGVYHSQFNNNERVEIYRRQLSDNPYKLLLGVRSSIFLPFKDLGLIIVDEEHDTSYKQQEPTPRYNCRDSAIYLASLFKAKTLLGTATPSIESYCNHHMGKYGLVTLNERYGGAQPPQIKLIDLQESYRKKQMRGHFSLELYNKINQTLANKQQVILFQNRRGYSPYVECKKCAYVSRCPNCDVSLTYHRATNSLTCHYCGYTQTMPQLCPSCRQAALTTRGFGTEQVEIETKEQFPRARVARLDIDTTRTITSFDKILNGFQSGEIDILVGTQMVAKGLDFNNVGLVGILNADNLLNAPDFRAYERAYQMLVQVSGRTGRRMENSEVIIQTSQPENPIIQQIVNDKFDSFFANQMRERNEFKYPPFYKLIIISIKHIEQEKCNKSADTLAKLLKMRFKERVLGPDKPIIERIQNKYIKNIIIKIEVSAPMVRAKNIIFEEISRLKLAKEFAQTIFSINVDPN